MTDDLTPEQRLAREAQEDRFRQMRERWPDLGPRQLGYLCWLVSRTMGPGQTMAACEQELLDLPASRVAVLIEQMQDTFTGWVNKEAK